MILRFLRILPVRTRDALIDTIAVLIRHRGILVATTRVEFAKRYAGSFLGLFWVALQPLLFLGVYLFVYLVVFKVRFPGYSELDYVLYVFAGLVPYIGFMEAISLGTVSIKQNIHLVKNVILPIDLIPARMALMSLALAEALIYTARQALTAPRRFEAPDEEPSHD